MSAGRRGRRDEAIHLSSSPTKWGVVGGSYLTKVQRAAMAIWHQTWHWLPKCPSVWPKCIGAPICRPNSPINTENNFYYLKRFCATHKTDLFMLGIAAMDAGCRNRHVSATKQFTSVEEGHLLGISLLNNSPKNRAKKNFVPTGRWRALQKDPTSSLCAP